ncbi:MAG: efflux RND transporter permease subunit, partial [Desulfomicrobium escambiense]|nr:efflux RND transporter permease subunit [Desulfomicrobium escambiense]
MIRRHNPPRADVVAPVSVSVRSPREIYRHFHPPSRSRAGGEPRDHHCRAAGDPRPQRPPVSPQRELASVTVTTVYVGASAELIRGFITTPLERAIAAADGIDYIQSQSAQGSSTIS